VEGSLPPSQILQVAEAPIRMTGFRTLGGIDLYPGALDKLREIRNVRRHPFGFYLRMGFEIVGVVPDSNGFGKPDIFMARRVADPRG
jgi:aminoglycoside 6'-N-acetyltransferase I